MTVDPLVDLFLVLSYGPQGQRYVDGVLAADEAAARRFVGACREYAVIEAVIEHDEFRAEIKPVFARTRAQHLWRMKQLAAGAPRRLGRGSAVRR